MSPVNDFKWKCRCISVNSRQHWNFVEARRTGLPGVEELGELDNIVSCVPGRPIKPSKEYGKTSSIKARDDKWLMGVGLLHSTDETCESRRKEGGDISLT